MQQHGAHGVILKRAVENVRPQLEVKSRRVGGSEVVALEACLRATGYDLGTGMLNLASTPLKGQRKRVLAYAWDALRGVYTDLRDHRAGRTGNPRRNRAG